MKLTILDTLEGAVELFFRAFFPLAYVGLLSLPAFLLCSFAGYAVFEASHSLASASLFFVALLLPASAGALGMMIVTLSTIQAGRRFRLDRVTGNMLDCWAQFMKLLVVQALVTGAGSLIISLCGLAAFRIFNQIANVDRAAANVTAIVAGVPLTLLALAVYGLFALISGIASVGCFVERTGGFTSLGLAWGRTIESGFLRRTLGIGMAMVLVSAGFEALITMLGLISRASVTAEKVRLEASLGSVALQIVFVFFIYSWFVVCYFRLRHRIEPLGFLKPE